MLDQQPTGPGVRVEFPFEVRTDAALGGLAEIKRTEIRFPSELQPRQTVLAELLGYGASPGDYDIRVENLKTGAGVRQTGDRPLLKLMFWSIRNTVCPEAYIDLRIEPGQESSWRIVYAFYDARR